MKDFNILYKSNAFDHIKSTKVTATSEENAKDIARNSIGQNIIILVCSEVRKI